jgi:hypothetical protein
MSPAYEDARRMYLPGRTPRPKVPGATLPAAAPTAFRGLGVWVGDIAGFPPDVALPFLTGYDWLAIKVAHGLEPIAFTAEHVRWMTAYMAASKRLLSWSWITAGADAYQQGRVHAERSFTAGHWLNGEKALALTSADGTPDPGAFVRSREWLRGYRETHATRPLGISPEPREDLDHKAWQTAGAAYGPQAYAENGFSVSHVYTYALQQGWGRDQIVPLVEPRGGGREIDASGEARNARELGLAGLCLYPGDGLLDRPDIWDAVRNGWRR